MRQQVVDFDLTTLDNSEYALRANALALWRFILRIENIIA